MRIHQIIWTLLLMSLPIAASAQTAPDSAAALVLPSQVGNFTVSARLDTNAIIVGQQTQLHIHISGLDNNNVRLPELKQLNNGPIEALESYNDTLCNKQGHTTDIEQTVTVTAFQAGQHTLTGIAVAVNSPQGLILLAPADSLTLQVAYAADADTTKCEVKADADYLTEPYTFWEISRWILLALLVALLVLAAIWIWKRRKANQPITLLPRAKPAPADKRALSELEALRRKELWQKGRIKKYYTDMTDIVRRFLRAMYGINATEMTSRQTLRAFHNIADWSEPSDTLLRQLLHRADMVKFAKSEPPMHEHDQAMQEAVSFIRTVADTHRLNNPETEEK